MNATLRENILKMIDSGRIEHVLGVEQESVSLARRWGADPERAGLAALLHDCTKSWDYERHLQFCRRYNIILGKLEKENPKLLHSITGALLARIDFGADDELSEAVRWHTVGRPGMTLLEKVVYLADKIEPERDYPEVARLRELAYQDIDKAVLAVMDNGIIKLVRDGRYIHPDTLEARNYFLTITNT